MIRELFPEEQKGCHKGTRESRHLLYIDQHIFKKIKTRRKNVAKAKIADKSDYDIILQFWMIDCQKIYKISDEVIKFIKEAMKTWKVEFTARGRILAEVKIQKCIFQMRLHHNYL